MLQLPYFWPQKCSTPAWCSVVGMSALSTKAAGHPGAGKFLAQGAEGWGKGSVPHRLYVTRPLLSPGSSCPEHHPHCSHAFGGIKEEPVSKAPQLTLNQQKALASCTQDIPAHVIPREGFIQTTTKASMGFGWDLLQSSPFSRTTSFWIYVGLSQNQWQTSNDFSSK